jgi:hypothetical protein
MPKPQPANPPSSAAASLLSELSASILNYVRAVYPGLYLVSAEEMRVEPEFKSLPSSLAEYTLHFWSTVDGTGGCEEQGHRRRPSPSWPFPMRRAQKQFPSRLWQRNGTHRSPRNPRAPLKRESLTQPSPTDHSLFSATTRLLTRSVPRCPNMRR